MKRFLLLTAALLAVIPTLAQTIHQASSFGIKSDGVTLNTRSIQAGIDYISEHGGGVLEFSVGRYLTGSIFLKDNVEMGDTELSQADGLPEGLRRFLEETGQADLIKKE